MKFKFLKLKKKKDFEKKHFNNRPHFFWGILLSVMFFVILCSFGFALYLFLRVNSEPVVSEADLGEQVETINVDKLNSTLDYFSEREQRSMDILKGSKTVVDPSL